MKTSIKFLKTGKILVEMRDQIERMSTGEFCTVESAEPVGNVGDEMCVGISDDVSPNACRSGIVRQFLLTTDNRGGFSGNSDRSIRRLHGWRGTTNDSSVTAHGWRRIEESAPLKRGRGWRTVFSADLLPEDA